MIKPGHNYDSLGSDNIQLYAIYIIYSFSSFINTHKTERVEFTAQILRPPGGFITVFSTLFNKAVLLSYAFTLGPYNPMVPYPTGPLKYPSWVKSGLSITYWQCTMKHSSLSCQYFVHGARDSANAAQPTVTQPGRHWQETDI